ncbi:AraC family transcriptional regulator [Nocardioides sp. Bht2]|uniref:AraC family transcriptional regulator n=1 Tax=Nocardioides sp. Bht2 TaxID=3392297 RepID=UPI0039B55C66
MLIPRRQTFTTTEIDDAESVDAWERHNSTALIELACTVPDGRPFRARELNVELDQLRLARVNGTAHTVARDEKMIAERPGAAIAAYAALRGEALLECNGKRQIIRPGHVVICDVDRPFLRGFGHGLLELAVKVPRSSFAAVSGVEDLADPVIVDSEQDPFARALIRLVGRAVNASVPLPVDEDAALGLVAMLATEGRTAARTAHLATARLYIDDHLTDPNLSAGEVARGAGLSERQLSRLFSQANTSVPRQILARRLDLAYAFLSQGIGERTVDTAARCGFISQAYFAESFRKRFGVTASQVLHQSRTPVRAGRDPGGRHAVHT